MRNVRGCWKGLLYLLTVLLLLLGSALPVSAIVASYFVTDSAGTPISGAKIEMVGDPNRSTFTDANGAFSLSGLPSGTTFSLKVSKEGYLPIYSMYVNTTNNISLPLPYSAVLFTRGEVEGWGQILGKGFVAAKILDENTPDGFLSCAVVTAASANHPDTPYPVTYFDGANVGGSCTYPNGSVLALNVDDGDTVTLQIMSHESTYAPVIPIHGDAQGGAYLSGKVISPRSGNIPLSRDFGNVPVGGSSATQTFTLTNNGPGNLTVLSAYWIGDTSQFSGSNGTCPTTWPFTFTPGESCDLTGAFTPKSVGVHRITFVVNSSANNTPVLNFPSVGTGVQSPPVSSVTFTSITPPTSTTVGTPVAFTASATGGVSPQYHFLVRTPGGVWSTAQAYGASATFNWTTTSLATGTYAIQVRARSAGSTASYEAVAQMNYTLNPPVTSVTFSSVSPPTSTTVGTPVAFTASATGGVSPQYQFLVRTPAGVWSTARAYGASITFNWTTTSLAKGTWAIQVRSRSAGSSASYEAVAQMNYRLQ